MGINKNSDELSILVDLDCLFDLRLNLLHKINKDKTKELLINDKYTVRFYDAFDFIDPISFRLLYKDLISDLIYEAPLTPMINFIIEYVTEASHANLLMNASDNMVVYLNIYPMVLDVETIENISRLIYSKLPNLNGSLKLVVINKSNAEITPEWISDNIAMMIKYNGIEWLELQLSNGNLVKKQVPDVSLFVPAIFMEKAMVDKSLYQQFLSDRGSEYSYYIKTDFLSSKIFSANIGALKNGN